MSASQHEFVAGHYAPRASDYVSSLVHSAGADLDQMADMVRGHGGARALDLGCGGGHVAYHAAPHVAEVVACDLTQDMLDVVAATARQRGLANISVRQAAAEKLPFADESFDFVLCRFTVHHWHEWEAGLREARRVLKPSGRAIFSDVVAPAHPLLDTHLQVVELLRDVSHVRDYTAAEWAGAVSRAGFLVTATTPRKLRMEFPTWIARTKTPRAHVEAIRAVQKSASETVIRHFAIDEAGSFDLDTLTMEMAPV